MGKYMYISFVKWSDKFFELGMDYFRNTWMPKHDEICKKWGVELLKMGIPFGTVEESVFVYDTDLELSKYQDFRGDVANINEGQFDYTRTTIVNCPS
jgi:hypothetical protein